MMKLQHDDVTCRIFPHALENKETTWYHSFLVSSIWSWDEFQKTFLENFDEDKAPFMLPTKLGMFKCDNKKRLKICLNKFPANVVVEDFIIVYYYTKALPWVIVVFVKP